MKEVIVIAGNEYMAVSIIRSLGIAGYRTRLIGLTKRTFEVAGQSKYVSAKVRCKENASEILKAMDSFRTPGERILVIPAQDRAIRMLDGKLDQLEASFFLPNINGISGNMVRFMSKKVQKQKAAECGLNVARGESFLTDRENDPDTVSKGSYPCFVKPLASASVKMCKRMFRKCDNPEELIRALDVARNHPCKEVLIEDFLEIDRELCAYGVAAGGNVCMPACVITERPGKLGHEGVASEGMVVSSDILGPVREKLIRFVQEAGLTGMFCIDLIESHNIIYFSEINLRAGGSGYGVTAAGVNLPAMLANAIYGGVPVEPCEIRNEVRFINERVEVDLFVDGFLGLGELRKAIAGDRVHFMKSMDDPAPWKVFKKYAFLSWVREKGRKLQRFLRRGRKPAKAGT